MKLAIIDCDSGNLRSVAKACEKAAGERGGRSSLRIGRDPALIAWADRIILPGVGAFAHCRSRIDPVMSEALDRHVRRGGKPFLGICIGMHILADTGFEHGETPGLGWIAGRVVPLAASRERKIPHMGWNDVTFQRPHPLWPEGGSAHFYFLHSYRFDCTAAGDIIADTDYGGRVTACVARDNIAGVQFHPEKSQSAGLRLLSRFMDWKPC